MGLVGPIIGNGQGSRLLGCSWGQELVLSQLRVPGGEVGRKIVGQACEGVWRGRLLVGLLAIGHGRCLTFGPICCQGRCPVMMGCDEQWPNVAPAKIGCIGTFGTRCCRSNWVVVG